MGQGLSEDLISISLGKGTLKWLPIIHMYDYVKFSLQHFNSEFNHITQHLEQAMWDLKMENV